MPANLTFIFEGFVLFGVMKIKIKQLTPLFWRKNSNLIEKLYDKNRGYGFTLIEVNNLLFAIPLRTRCHRKTGVILDTIKKNKVLCYRGFDMRKAVLIKEPHLEIGELYEYDPRQEKSMRKVEEKGTLKKEFNRYVTQYIIAARNNKSAVLKNEFYRYSTLVNYHHELEIFSEK